MVLGLQVAQVLIGALLKLSATATRAATVHAGHNETLLGEILVIGTALAHGTGIP